MKHTLAILAAGILAVAPLSAAVAEDLHAGAAVETDIEGTLGTAVAAPAINEYKLSDGTVIFAQGDAAWTLDAEGNKVPAVAGKYTLASGTAFELTVEEGKVAGFPAMESAAEAVAGEEPAAGQ